MSRDWAWGEMPVALLNNPTEKKVIKGEGKRDQQITTENSNYIHKITREAPRHRNQI